MSFNFGIIFAVICIIGGLLMIILYKHGLLTTPSAFFFGILLRITKTGTDKIGD